MKKKHFNIMNFINNNKNWRELLAEEPYRLTIRDDGVYTILKYNQIFSDLTNPIVKEARGLIIKKNNKGLYEIVCAPFTKFFGFRDPNARNDLRKLYKRKTWFIQQKIDGSLIKLWWDDGDWHISTNGTIDASKATLQFPMNDLYNYRDLFIYASKDKIDYSKLDKQYSYLFELVGLENKVIVSYNTEDVYYLGRRNKFTLLETPYDKDDCFGLEKCKRPDNHIIQVQNPKKQMLNIQNRANNLTKSDEHFEGYVVSDKGLKTRIKIKSSQYMDLFHQKGNGIFTPRKILLMILNNEDDDFISLFPEYKPVFENVREHLSKWINNVMDDIQYGLSCHWDSKKEFAEWAKQTCCPSVIFKTYTSTNVDYDWLINTIKDMNVDSLLNFIDIKIKENKEDKNV